jgi:hypothetical protein
MTRNGYQKTRTPTTHAARRGLTVLEVVVTAALFITITAFVVPRFMSGGPNAGAAKTTLLSATTAAYTVKDETAAWGEDTDKLEKLTSRTLWLGGAAASTDTGEVSYAVDGAVAGFAVSAGEQQCWLAQLDSSANGGALYAVSDDNAVSCTAAAALLLNPANAPAGRGEELSKPMELTP